MGVNLFWADPIEDAQCVGFAREFHDWRTDQNDSEFNGPGIFSTPEPQPFIHTYPDECYTWNPTHSGVIDFDYFYNTLIANGLTVSPTMNNSIFPYAGYVDIDDPTIDENDDGDDIFYSIISGNIVFDTVPIITKKPLEWLWNQNSGSFQLRQGVDPLASVSYEARANWIYNFMAKHGGGANIPNVAALHLCGTEDPTSLGQNQIRYIESWNEPTKTWNGPEAEFSPEEYAAMANCDFDGWDGTQAPGQEQVFILDAAGNSTGIPMGIRHLYTQEQVDNGELRFVMAAPHWIVEDACAPFPCDANYEFFDGTQCAWNVWDDWIVPMENHLGVLRTNNLPGEDDFIFDVINVHHYSFDGGDVGAATWISPEEDELRQKLAWLRGKMATRGWKDNANPEDDLELWLSEFGYDTNEFTNANSNGPWFGPNTLVNGLTAENMQARWTVRSFLELAAAGVDRAILHDLADGADDADNPIGAWDVHTGLLTSEGAPKEAWFFVYTMNNILEGFNFTNDDESINCDYSTCDVDCADVTSVTRVYRFDNAENETVWAVWSPTACENFTEYTINLDMASGTNAATGFRLTAASTNGIGQALVQNPDGTFQVPVSEVPLFIVEEALNAPVCPALSVVETTCASVSIDVDIPFGQSYDSYQVWFGVGNIADPNFAALSGNVTQFGYNFPGDQTNISLIGLLPNTQYTVFVIPENENGIPVDAAGDPLYCSIGISISTPSESICHIPLTEMTILETIGDGNGIDELFDEQEDMDLDAFCSTNPPIPTTKWINFNPLDDNVSQVTVEFNENYIIDQFYLFDMESSGLIQFEFSIDGATWGEPIEYYTDAAIDFSSGETGVWVPISNFDVLPVGIKHIRVTATSASARLGELLICGRPVCTPDNTDLTVTPSCVNAIVTISDGDCAVSSWFNLALEENAVGDLYNIQGSPATIPPFPTSFGDLLIPGITYFYENWTYNGTVQSISASGQFTTSSPTGTGCIQGAPIIRKGYFKCSQQGPPESPKAMFFIPASIPANYKMQFWLSTNSASFLSTEHPLVTDASAQSIIVQPGPAVYMWNLGWVRHVLLDNLINGQSYTGTYRYITETESSVLYNTIERPWDTAPYPSFEFTAFGCQGGGGSSSLSLVAVDCDVIGALKMDTRSSGSYEFSERTNTSSNPTISALATAARPATGEDIFYVFQDTTSMKYLYWRWTDGLNPDPWEYIETDIDPCLGAGGKNDDFANNDRATFAKIYPNPTKSTLNLQCENCTATELYSIDGRKISLNLLEKSDGHYQFDTSELPDGMYFLQITNSAGEREALRFIVQQ